MRACVQTSGETLHGWIREAIIQRVWRDTGVPLPKAEPVCQSGWTDDDEVSR